MLEAACYYSLTVQYITVQFSFYGTTVQVLSGQDTFGLDVTFLIYSNKGR
jgi:hypothetical protein